MSEFSTVSIDIVDQDALVDALVEMGYKPLVSKEAKKLHGYQGDQRNQKAHVIIPKSQVGGASNDVGFEKLADGSMVAHISEYDRRSNFNTTKLNKVKQLYAQKRIEKKLKLKGSKYRIKSKTVDNKGNIKIKVSMRA